MEKLRVWMENREEEVKVLIGEDFYAKTGREGRRVGEKRKEGVGEGKKWSRDGKINEGNCVVF